MTLPSWLPPEWARRYRRYANHSRSHHGREPVAVAHYLLYVTQRPVSEELRALALAEQERRRGTLAIVARAEIALREVRRRAESRPDTLPERMTLEELARLLVSVGRSGA